MEIKYNVDRKPTADQIIDLYDNAGLPRPRFVSIKEIVENSFVVAGTITSQKGIEINLSNKVALTI